MVLTQKNRGNLVTIHRPFFPDPGSIPRNNSSLMSLVACTRANWFRSNTPPSSLFLTIRRIVSPLSLSLSSQLSTLRPPRALFSFPCVGSRYSRATRRAVRYKYCMIESNNSARAFPFPLSASRFLSLSLSLCPALSRWSVERGG